MIECTAPCTPNLKDKVFWPPVRGRDSLGAAIVVVDCDHGEHDWSVRNRRDADLATAYKTARIFRLTSFGFLGNGAMEPENKALVGDVRIMTLHQAFDTLVPYALEPAVPALVVFHQDQPSLYGRDDGGDGNDFGAAAAKGFAYSYLERGKRRDETPPIVLALAERGTKGGADLPLEAIVSRPVFCTAVATALFRGQTYVHPIYGYNGKPFEPGY